MASNGLINKAKTGKCRMCFRVRNTDKFLRIVGEVRHGFATGHLWECKDEDECQHTALNRINNPVTNEIKRCHLKAAQKAGRANKYIVIV